MGQHWYTGFGEPRYDAKLKEARQIGLLPSIITVEKIIANPGLDEWKKNQVLEASLTLTQEDGEPDYDFIARIKRDSKEQGRKAARLGNVIHKLAERYITGKPLFYIGLRKDVWLIFDELKKWIDANLVMPDFGFFNNEGAEVIIVNEGYGYAGKCDYKGKHKNGKTLLLDFKSTFINPWDIKKNGELMKKKIYPAWGRQLAALRIDEQMVLSVIVSTNVECLGVWIYEWGQEELAKAWREFRSALELFKSIKGL